MIKEVKVYISPSKGSNEISSWEDKIKENYGPLSGYISDLKEKGVNQVLLDILQYQGENMIANQNYFNIKGIYLEHVKSLQADLENEDSTLKKEIENLEGNNPSSQTVDILIKYGILPGIEFFIPYEKVYRGYSDIMGDNVFQGVDAQAPYKKYWDETFKDVNYTPEKEVPFKYSDIKLAVQVLVYSKAKFKLFDITNFLSEVNTFVSKTSGGNFNMKMHLVSVSELEAGSNFQDHNLNITGYTKALFLQSIFRENDLVFIRFENLKAENQEGELDDSVPRAQAKRENKRKATDKKIKGKYWDMIGLIDSTSIMSDYNSLNITITGRDLIKLVIEDNNFFIPYQWANSPDTIFGGKHSKKIFKRLFATGEYNLEFVRSLKSIENSLGFIFSQLTNIEVLSDSCVKFLQKEYNNDLAYIYLENGKEKKLSVNGIWGLVQFYVDEKISHLRLADASLKNPQGSTMQQVLKICQEPFVEIIADTFVDKYNFIARRPPFTIEDIAKSNFFVIGRDSSISDNLSFSKDIYTVYQLTPQGGCFTDNSSIALSYLPMVVLDDYTRLWGNKLYSQVYNYINVDTFNQIDDDTKKQKSMKENFIEALIWLIESTAYLPFSRTGQIVIKGDRRIKVGQWIYYEKTNEVFYVDAVNHSVSIAGGMANRVTTLNVSRGLVKDYVKPVEKKTGMDISVSGDTSKPFWQRMQVKHKKSISNMSYGDLVDIDLLREGLKELCIKMNKGFSTQREVKDGDTFKSNSSLVVSEVFNFFLSGAQFEGKVTPYVLYYNQAAVSLGDLNRKQGNGAGYSMSISTSHTEGSGPAEGGNNEQPAERREASEGGNMRTGHMEKVPWWTDGEKWIWVWDE